jgi:3D (Asp-Asp-Asp) domain-containing protein
MRRARALLHVSLGLAPVLAACGGWGGGTKWVEQPLGDEPASSTGIAGELPEGAPRGSIARPGSKTLGAPPERSPGGSGSGSGSGSASASVDRTGGGGRALGTFRNTYYDFPRQQDHRGNLVGLMNARCQPIARVPQSFFEAVCVQGSGSLEGGGTVSFAKRDCPCADVCPRTGQRICFDTLDPIAFPWGRGAAGTAITPMKTLAADTAVLPMGTVVYIPELDGAPRGETGASHDGCFVVEDRGLKVTGEHVDIFTGHAAQTALMNERVPSNQGVTVVVAAPRCAHMKER